MRTRQKRELFSEINITPLTDIFLVLLIIMMVVAPMLDTSGLKLSVPTIGPSEEAKEEPKVMRLEISPDGQYTINKEPVSSTLLGVEIRKLQTEHPDGLVIEADPESSHEALTFAMDAAQSAGVNKMAVTSTKPEEAAAELSKLE